MKLQSAGALYPTDYKLRPTGQGRLRLHEHRTTKCDSFWADVAFLVFVLRSGLYGQWTPTYPLSIPLSLEEGGLLPVRLR